MTSELEMAVERLDTDLCCQRPTGLGTVAVLASDVRLILSANREMREALEFYADEPAREFPSDGPWGVNSDDFGRVARSALTQRGDGE